MGRDGRRRPATRPPRKRAAAPPDDDAPPPTPGEQVDSPPDLPEATSAQASAGTEIHDEAPAPEFPEQAPLPPLPDTGGGPDPPPPEEGGRRTGVTAKQSARDRSNRIVSVVADKAVHLTAQNDLIDFSGLDREQLPQWIEELEEACRLLRGFIRRLRKEV